VWLLWGDGSAGYSIMEYDTFVRHGISVIGVIGNDRCAGNTLHCMTPRAAVAGRKSHAIRWRCSTTTSAARSRLTVAMTRSLLLWAAQVRAVLVRAVSVAVVGWQVADGGDDVLGKGETVGVDNDGRGGTVPPESLDAVLARAKQIAAAGRPTLVNAMIGVSTFREGSISI
jgi:hypothetical protein